MSQLIEALNKKRLTLIVSLPENSLELAKAAEAGGADALKVHLNVKHAAAGTEFGTFNDERAVLEDILDGADIPVGLMPGAEYYANEEEMAELKRMGMDFFDMLFQDVPAWMLRLEDLGKVVAVDEKYSIDRVVGLGGRGAQAVEAAIVPKKSYGQKLTVGDLQHYISVAIATELPVIIPTQKAITPAEVRTIHDTGAKGLMIGAIVTGKTAKSIEEATSKFRKAIDDLE